MASFLHAQPKIPTSRPHHAHEPLFWRTFRMFRVFFVIFRSLWAGGKVRRPPKAAAYDSLRENVSTFKRDGLDQAGKSKVTRGLRALRLFRDVLVLKTFVGLGGVLHGVLSKEPTILADSVQDALEFAFDRDLPNPSDELNNMLISWTHIREKVSKVSDSTGQEGVDMTMDQFYRKHLLPAERLQLFTVYRDLNRFPKKEIFPLTNTKRERKAKKKTQPAVGGTGPSGPEKASEETRQRGARWGTPRSR